MFTARKSATNREAQETHSPQDLSTESLKMEMTTDREAVRASLADLHTQEDVKCITPGRDGIIVVTGSTVRLYK